MKKHVLFLLAPLPFLLQSCFFIDYFQYLQRTPSLYPTGACLDDYFFLTHASICRRDKYWRWYNYFSYNDEGYLSVYFLYSALFVEDGWSAEIYLNFFGDDDCKSYFYQMDDCCDIEHEGYYNDDWFDFGGKAGDYTYMAKQYYILSDTVPFGLFKNKYSSALFTLEFRDKNDDLFETFSNYASISYNEDIVTINFGNFYKDGN